MPALLLDLTHTCHSRARTGVQRVTRALWRELGDAALPVTHDPFEGVWRPLEAWERSNLAADQPAASRRAHWPPAATLRGRFRRWSRPVPDGIRLPDATEAALLVPEIFTAATARALPRLLARVRGPRVALFHDALALQFPEYAPADTVARFPAYLQELLQFDGIAAVSDTSCASLLDYWAWLGQKNPPPVTALPLGIDPPPPPPEARPAARATVLCVSTLEGRKNHLALLAACEALWSGGASFNLHLIGPAHPETGSAAQREVRRLQQAGRPVRYDGPVADGDLERAYAACHFTVYPSLAEGFGLPIAESLARGKPCLCRFDGALGELARPGGCVSIGMGSSPEIAAAMSGLLDSGARLAELSAAARQRVFRSWDQYAADLRSWMRTLERHA